MKNFLPCILFLLLFSSNARSQSAANTWSVKFSTAIINRYQPTINTMTSKGWEYSNSIILHGIEKVYNNVTDSARYLSYIQAFADTYVTSAGAFTGSVALTSLDRVHPGISLLFLYEKTGLTKYKTAATTLRNLLVGSSSTYSKTANGILWHKLSGYNNISMLDGMYMAHPFLVKYGRLFGDNAAIDTAVNQVLFMYYQLYDNTTHLIKHAWTSTPGSYTWATAGTGNSKSVWSRGMGWYMMALVDILKYLPASHPRRSELLTALGNLAIGVKNYQDPSTGLWYQVVDKGSSLSGNYLETSGSGLFVYAIKTAVDSGWISSATYLPVAQNGWTGLKTKIDTYTDGQPRINSFAPAMSVQDGDANYVAITPVSCPVVSGTQNPHGYAAILMAASVMEFPLNIITLPVKFIKFTATAETDKTKLFWQIAEENGIDHYEIQRSVNGSSFLTTGSVVSSGSSLYNWTDNNINTGNTDYRIKAVSVSGVFYYSPVLVVNNKNRGFAMHISPNPVTDHTINISLTNIKPGKYNLQIFNSGSAKIVSRELDVDNEAALIQAIQLPSAIQKGVYYIQLNGNGIKTTNTLLIQ
jgi:unsaturated rhamnogalacturonyl hydrolase